MSQVDRFFHIPDGSQADLVASTNRRTVYESAFGLSIPMLIIAAISRPELSGFLLQCWGVFSVDLGIAYTLTNRTTTKSVV